MKSVQVLDIQQFEKNTINPDFYANTFVKHLEFYHKSITIPHKHNFYVTVLFTQGSGIHEIDFNAYTIQPGSIFLLNPGQTHHWVLSDDCDGFIFFHTQAFYDFQFNSKSITNFPFFFSTQNPPFIYIDQEQLEKMIRSFTVILEEYENEYLLKRQKIISLIDMMYIDMTRLYEKENDALVNKSNPYADKLKHLERLIETHFLTEKSPAGYADRMNISTKHLNRITKTVLGKTTSDLIIERIILEAKRMFVQSRDSFTNIALYLGYDDYAYFSRLFKSKTNETPSQFIERYK